MTHEDNPVSREYDPAQRRTAARVQDRNPHWFVLWGVSSQRFWAFPMFDAVPGTIVSAADPRELLALMARAETAAGPDPGPSGPHARSQSRPH